MTQPPWKTGTWRMCRMRRRAGSTPAARSAILESQPCLNRTRGLLIAKRVTPRAYVFQRVRRCPESLHPYGIAAILVFLRVPACPSVFPCNGLHGGLHHSAEPLASSLSTSRLTGLRQPEEGRSPFNPCPRFLRPRPDYALAQILTSGCRYPSSDPLRPSPARAPGPVVPTHSTLFLDPDGWLAVGFARRPRSRRSSTSSGHLPHPSNPLARSRSARASGGCLHRSATDSMAS